MSFSISTSDIRIAFIALLTAFIAVVIMGPGFIPMLHRMKFGQEVRDDGPKEHLKKQGTPTMGGIMFLIAIVAASLIGLVGLKKVDSDVIKLLLMTAGFGLVGFADDMLKIKKHQSEGLKAWQKLLFQLIITVAFIIWICMTNSGEHIGNRVYIPFTGMRANALYFDIPIILFIPFAIFVILGTDNGVNLTDGLDGLCSSVTVIVALFFMIIGFIEGTPGLSVVSAAVAGSLLGFLIFNVNPAKVFMGDTGSLALGGYVAASAVLCGYELYIPIVGFIYLVEAISVIIQVGYFKATHGKRFFRMAPIHHHFELCGNKETVIVEAFTIITALLAMLAFIGASF